MNRIDLIKKINDAIFKAVKEGYYHKECDFLHPNYGEIRNWIGAPYISYNYTREDAIIDDYIENALKAIWLVVEE